MSKARYGVIRMDWSDPKAATEKMSGLLQGKYDHCCDGLSAVWDYCGGKLHRERCGYSGIYGQYEYVAVRIA